jgi:hypothetical protein
VQLRQYRQMTEGGQRTAYFVTLLLVAVAAFLLMAPPIHHRILFRHGEKGFLLRVANRLAIEERASWRSDAAVQAGSRPAGLLRHAGC